MTTLLAVTGLHVGFGETEVVRGVSFELAAGETLAIVGESGSGKSVTALSINRLVDFGGGRITSGRIEFVLGDGRTVDLAAAPERELQHIRGNEIGMIFQEPMTSLNPVKTVGAQLAESFRLHRGLRGAAAMTAAEAMLDRVRIPDARRRLGYYPHQLSGGMRQRVVIAIALACNPRLLIADEPTTALDVTVQAQIMALLAELRRELGMSMIFITHDVGLVAEVADRVLVMQRGEIVEQGPLAEILDAPQHPYTRHLLQAVPHFSGGVATRVVSTKAVEPILAVDGLVVRFPVGGAIPAHAGPCTPLTGSTLRSGPVRLWPSSAKAARANPPPPARCWGSPRSPAARFTSSPPPAGRRWCSRIPSGRSILGSGSRACWPSRPLPSAAVATPRCSTRCGPCSTAWAYRQTASPAIRTSSPAASANALPSPAP